MWTINVYLDYYKLNLFQTFQIVYTLYMQENVIICATNIGKFTLSAVNTNYKKRKLCMYVNTQIHLNLINNCIDNKHKSD